jgi:predicted PurR-regulated permease PerM
MNERVDRIKKHFKENKKVYIGVTAGLVVGVVAGVFITTHTNSGTQLVQKINQIGFRNEANPVIIQLVELSTPSKPVHLVGTDQFFNSIHDASRKTGHTVNQISRQVNGITKDVNGDMFEFLESAA